MIVHVHGFNWSIYAQHVMPAFARWFLDGDETAVYQLYKQTRCFKEEQATPLVMQSVCNWPRAQMFVRRLPRGTQARYEYQQLCDVEQFTSLSDRYVYRYQQPGLYQPSDAVRSIWGAIVEQHCLPWKRHAREYLDHSLPTASSVIANQQATNHYQPGELHVSAGLERPPHLLGDHLHNISIIEQTASDFALLEQQHTNQLEFDIQNHHTASLHDTVSSTSLHLLEQDEPYPEVTGIVIGRLPTTLFLRGWLARNSIRAMALFELLACGRRNMPFGYQEGNPYGSYIGYLTLDEVRQLAECLQEVEPPDPAEALADYDSYRQQLGQPKARLIDEVLPAHAAAFLHAVHTATLQELGLICSMD